MSKRHELEGRSKEVREVVGGPWNGKGGESCGEGKSVEFGGRISHTQMWVVYFLFVLSPLPLCMMCRKGLAVLMMM